jgi:hypothetical protein
MANDNINRGPQSQPATTVKNHASPFVPMHVGKSTVQVDPRALRHLIDTLRAKVDPESKVSN